MDTYLLKYFATAIICVLSSCGSLTAASQAEEEGSAVVLVESITLSQFAENRYSFRENVAKYASIHCKRKSSNCKTEDNHIRVDNVRVTSEWREAGGVAVRHHILDYQKEDEAALTSSQLASVFYEHGDDFQQDFGYPVEVLEPQRNDWEGWRIAVVTILSVILLALIILAFVLLYQSKEESQNTEQQKQEERDRHLSKYDSITLDDATTLPYEKLREESFTGSAVSTPRYEGIDDFTVSGLPETSKALDVEAGWSTDSLKGSVCVSESAEVAFTNPTYDATQGEGGSGAVPSGGDFEEVDLTQL